MSYFITTPRFIRPDQPQPVWQPVVDPIVASWSPVFRSQLRAERSAPDPMLSLYGAEWNACNGWTNLANDAVVKTWSPIFASELKGLCSDASSVLDVRRHEWKDLAWIVTANDRTVRTWSPIFDAQLLGQRSQDGARLDLSGQSWAPESGWTNSSVDTVVRTWAPAWNAQLAGMRSGSGATLDVRQDVLNLAWIYNVTIAGPTVAQMLAVFVAGLNGYRVAGNAMLDPRSTWTAPPAWLQPVTDAAIAQYAPVWGTQRASMLTENRRGHGVQHETAPGFGWIFTTLPSGLTVAQMWPALLQGLSSLRLGDRPALDVRQDWVQAVWPTRVVDSTVARWAPVFIAQPSFRVVEKPTLELWRPPWNTNDGWQQRVVDGRVALWVPAFRAEDTRTVPGVKSLSLYGQTWSAEPPNMQQTVDAIVALWIPAFNAELATFRSTPGAVVDVRFALVAALIRVIRTFPSDLIVTSQLVSETIRTIGVGTNPDELVDAVIRSVTYHE